MAAGRQRGSRVIYVAGAAREFPQDVQDWLSRTPHRPAASPHIYDALAMLASGRKPAAIIVSLESVDWDELEFFDLAPRLSRDTRVFAAGAEHQAAKLKAALARGAEAFDAQAVDDLLATAEMIATPASAALLAGTLAPKTAQALPKMVEPEPTEPQEPAADVESTASPQDARPPVRLVSSAEFEDSEAPVPFPWAPAANRPQRTPPRAAQPSVPPEAPPGRTRQTQPVMLTAEELAALLGRKLPSKDLGKAGEGGS